MKTIITCWLFTFVLYSSNAQTTEAANPDDQSNNFAAVSLLRDIRIILEKQSKANNSLGKKIVGLRLQIVDINSRLVNNAEELPDEYLTSLDNLRKQLPALSQLSIGDQDVFLARFSRDLKLKFGDRTNSMESSIATGLVEVEVQVVQNGRAVNSLRPVYSPIGFSVNYEHPEGRFRTLTSPAKEKLVPGFYIIWLLRDGKQVSKEQWMGEISPETKNVVQMSIP